MKKALIITSVASMVDQFFLPNIRLLQDMGCQVHLACNFRKGSTCSPDRIEALKQYLTDQQVTFFQIDFSRSVTALGENLRAYRQIAAILAENHYDMIHCHSPIGGLIGRLAGRKARRRGTKVLYTAHGFHFYRGAAVLNWLLYYPIEKFCARLTDVLITINREDYALACRKMKKTQIAYVPGVGIELQRFGRCAETRMRKRQELGIPENATLLLSVGELNRNKNHETVLQAIADTQLYYIIAGKGPLADTLQHTAHTLGLDPRVQLLGFRQDIRELCQAADIFVFPSFREGLSVALMEAMASGLPVVCSQIRGNTDLIDEHGGVLFDPHSPAACSAAITQCLAIENAGAYNQEKVRSFSTEAVAEHMKTLYNTYVFADPS